MGVLAWAPHVGAYRAGTAGGEEWVLAWGSRWGRPQSERLAMTQILVDAVIAGKVKDSVAIVSLGKRTFKGYDHALQVFAVANCAAAIRDPGYQQKRRKFEPAKQAV